MFIMVKLILEILLLLILLGGAAMIVNYLIYFWINRRRKWKQEDEEFNARKKQEALKDLMDTQNMLESAKDDYIEHRAYKTKSADKLLERL